MATLNLNDGWRTKTWRLVKDKVAADPVYEAAGLHVVFADGPDRENARGLETYDAGVLRFTPALGEAKWFDEGSLSAALVVNVEAALRVADTEDLFNLQEALEDTLNTIADTAFQQSLVDQGGAETGLVEFPEPFKVAAGKADDGLIRALGRFVVQVRRPLTP